MRTTVAFDVDTANAIDALRRERGTGVSEVVNELIRRGMHARAHPEPYTPIRRDLGLTIDISNVADALDYLEGSDTR